MYIKKADIQNYHGIENLHVDFAEGVNLLIGNNGAGKTSLLCALSAILQVSLAELKVSVNMIDSSDAYQITTKIGDSTFQTIPQFPIKIDSSIIWNNTEYRNGCYISNSESTFAFSNLELMHDLQKNMGEGKGYSPIMCFFPAQRGKLKNVKINTISLSGAAPQRIQGYQNAFSGAQNIQEIQQWCVQMEFAEYQKKQKIHEYTEFQSIVSGFCSEIDEKAEDPKVSFSSEKGSLVYFNGKDEKTLPQLSDGYQAALCMIIELAYRAVILNPSMSQTARNVEGVVLIDEIEMHLHPAWQWKILNAFRKTFPKVQFIVATHSPVILSSANNARLLLMKSPNEILELSNAYGYNIDDVLSFSQGTISQPAKVKAYYDKIECCLENGEKEKLRQLLEEAKEELKASPAVLKSILDFVEINSWVEEA